MIYTSLTEIKSFNPCASGWQAILKGQAKTEADSVLFPLTDALDSNSFSDICWLLGKRKSEIQVCVRAARMCADSVKHLKNANAANAASYAAYAYAANAYAYAASDSASASYAYADSNSAAASYASDAAYAAYAASDSAQNLRNKQFLRQCIVEWQEVS